VEDDLVEDINFFLELSDFFINDIKDTGFLLQQE
jgi:hypothetical protein